MPITRQSQSSLRVTLLTLAVAIGLGIGAGLLLNTSGDALEDPAPVSTKKAEVDVRTLPIFHGLSFKRKGGTTQNVQIMVRAGDEQAVSIVAMSGVHKSVHTRVIDGILHIMLDRDLSGTEDLRIQIASPRLDMIAMDGVSSVRVNGGLRTPSIKLEASRGAQITARRLGARQLNVAVRRGGRIMIGGRTSLLRARASSGIIEAGELSAEVAKVSSVDRSRVEVDAQNHLEAYARDRATIMYRHRPVSVLEDLDRSSRLQML